MFFYRFVITVNLPQNYSFFHLGIDIRNQKRKRYHHHINNIISPSKIRNQYKIKNQNEIKYEI